MDEKHEVWMRPPNSLKDQTKWRRLSATTAEISRLMVAGWKQCPIPDGELANAEFTEVDDALRT